MAFRTGFAPAALVQHLKQGPRSAPVPVATEAASLAPRDWVGPVLEQVRALPRLDDSERAQQASAAVDAASARLATERTAVAMAVLCGAVRELATCWRMHGERAAEAACASVMDAVNVAVRNME